MKYSTPFAILLALFLLVNIAHAQFYVSGQDRGTTKWMQIKTESFRLVFPDYAEKQAQLLANELDACIPHLEKDIHNTAKRLDIIMHMESATSNGMVMWAPKRMEVFNTPSQDMEAHNWWGHLALHEYRHVLQVDKLNQGFTKALTYLVGQQATGAVLGLYLPLWYIEGDAVVSETKFSSAGRGRNPVFSQGLRTQLIEKGKYSYDKAYFGSYKDFVPNHYVLGYHMVVQANRMYGDDFWNQHIDFVARNPYAIAPFAWSLKKTAGVAKNKLYHLIMDSLYMDWKAQLGEEEFSHFWEIPVKDSKHFVNYRFPQQLDDKSFLVVKEKIGDVPRFIIVDSTGKERRLHTPGYSDFYNLNAKSNKLVWAERYYHPRWEHVKYNNIMILDMTKKVMKVKKLTSKGRYFAPQLNHDASKIVCVEVTEANEYALVVLNANSGEILHRIVFQNFIMMPVWSPRGDEVVFLELMPNEGKTITRYHFESGEVTRLMDPTFVHMNRVSYFEDELIVQAAFNGVMNAYRFSEPDESFQQITNLPFGVEDISESQDGKLLYSNYTASGFKPVKQFIPGDDDGYLEIAKIENRFVSYSDELVTDSTFNIQDIQREYRKYEVTRYRKVAHLFNPHSWGPFALDANTTSATPGLSLSSQNSLGTSLFNIGLDYDLNEGANRNYMKYSYLGWYPEIKLILDRRDRYGRYIDQNQDTSTFLYYQNGAHLNMGLPFKLNKGKFLQYIKLSAQYSYLGLQSSSQSPEAFTEDNYHILSYRMYAYRLLRKGNKDIAYRRGFFIDLNYRNTLMAKLNEIYSGEISVYAPGILRYHSMEFYLGRQWKTTNDLNYSNLIATPRGFIGYNKSYDWSFQFDYRFPIAYPDISIGPLAYIQRVKAAILYDFAPYVDIPTASNYHQSTSFELSVDGHFFRFIAPIELGLRYSILDGLSQNATFVQLIFNVDFSF